MKLRLRTFLFVAVTTGLSSVLSLLGGISLELVSKKLIPLVPLIIALPALNTLVGDYASIIASHTGDKSERKKTHRELFRAVYKVVAFNVASLSALSIALAIKRGYMNYTFFVEFIIFITLSILAIVLFMFAINKALDRLLEKNNLYPDDLLIPISTGLADFLMLSLISIAVLFIF